MKSFTLAGGTNNKKQGTNSFFYDSLRLAEKNISDDVAKEDLI